MTTRPAVSRSDPPDPSHEERPLSPPAETWVLAAEHPDGFLALSGVRGCRGELVDFTWLYLNPAAEALLGRPLADLLGRSLLTELPDFRLPPLLARCVRVVETGEPFVDEVAFSLTLPGRWFRLVALRRGDGLALWLTDITRGKREEQEVRFLAEASNLIGKPVHVRVETGAEHVRLCVTDEGIGIAPESLPRLFGRFQRAVSERHYGGLGLGLYFTRQIVESLGGTIRVSSAPGAGATFRVDLPRKVTG